VFLLTCIAAALFIYLWDMLLTDRVSEWLYYTIFGFMAGVIVDLLYYLWHEIKEAENKCIYFIAFAVITIIKILSYMRKTWSCGMIYELKLSYFYRSMKISHFN
jgi:heme/copper-type cytochrome/quinol oxidase subunit 4